MSANPCNVVDAVMFVQKFRADCELIAKQLNVPVENILGLAAQESEYGRGRIASEYNNYFSMHAPAPGQLRAEPARKDPKVKVAVFGSFAASAQSFATKFGSAVNGKSDPKQFANALVGAGFNPGSAEKGGRTGFADYLARIIEQVKARMACPAR
jgi:flagellum-specific peptidoglycan hydrolase FlgJ